MNQSRVTSRLEEKEKIRKRLKNKKRKQRKMIMQTALSSSILLVCVCLGINAVSQKKKQQEKIEETLKEVQGIAVAQGWQEMNQTRNQESVQEGQVIMTRDDLSKGNLVVVNEKYPLREYGENNLSVIAKNNEGHYQVKSESMQLNQEALTALNEMIGDFNQIQKTSDLIIISGYRNFNEQEKIHYDTLVSQGQTHTDAYVAKPDRSEHHTGLAVDFGLYDANGTSSEYDGTGIYSWINENCYKYGFVLRYDEAKKDKTGISYEPWHFRYVGRVHAQLMYELNLCLEEYITYLKSYSYYTNPGQGITDTAKNYSIYYVSAENDTTVIPVPTQKSYSISGNNIDGFIVTVQLDEEEAKS